MPATSFLTRDHVGRQLSIPVTPADDADPRFYKEDLGRISHYYDEHGYVVVRSVVPSSLCERANKAFDREVKVDERPFYRLSGRPERHLMTGTGFMEHGIRDVQSLDHRRHGGFRGAALDVLTHGALQKLVAGVLGEQGQIVQTMYFEGNPATQPHQDSYYLDGERLGSMTAAWVACEDIAPGAGRFWVCPGSHRLDLPRNTGEYNIAQHHDRYLSAVTKAICDTPLEVKAPALTSGDVLLWAAMTIHGSLLTDTPEQSRRSFTAHFIPDSSRFLQWQHRIVPLDRHPVAGVEIHHPKDQNQLRHRVRYHAETALPGPTATAKRVLSSRILRRRAD